MHYTEEYGVPVIHLSWHSDDPKYCRDALTRPKVPAEVLVGGHAHQGATLRCRGHTSVKFPKKSFTLHFDEDDPFHAPPGLEQLEGRRRLALTQTFDDNSQLRTRLAFELWNRTDPAVLRLDHGSAVVFVDGQYQGLYQITDSVDEQLLALRGLDPRGPLFSSTEHSGNYRTTFNDGSPKSSLAVGYEKDEGEPADDFSALESLLHWVSDSTPETFERTLDATLRHQDFVDWYLFATAIMARDSYAKNSFVYLEPGGVWRCTIWDMNDSFGQDWATRRVAFDLEGKAAAWPIERNGIWQRFLESEALTAEIDARFAAALAGPLGREQVLALFDAYHAEIEAAARRDDRKWDAARRSYGLWSARTDFTDFAGESAYLRDWIDRRWRFLESLY